MLNFAGTVKKRLVFIPVIFLVFLLAFSLWRFIGRLNTAEFCTSCHSMSFALEEYKESRHYMSPSGVRAGCPDCHVGRGLRKLFVFNQLIPDLWAEFRGPIKDIADWEKRRKSMAEKARNGVRCSPDRCIGCHNLKMMKPFNERVRVAHERIKREGMGCLECHRNLVHAEVD